MFGVLFGIVNVIFLRRGHFGQDNLNYIETVNSNIFLQQAVTLSHFQFYS